MKLQSENQFYQRLCNMYVESNLDLPVGDNLSEFALRSDLHF